VYCDLEDRKICVMVRTGFRIVDQVYPPDASIPTETKNPLIWQKRELPEMGPWENTKIGYSMYQRALNMSLCINNIMRLFARQHTRRARMDMTYSCRKFLRILTNQ
jgi:hypothetical protein